MNENGEKKILIVSRDFHPIIAPRSFRATELAKELSRKGHNVTVLTPKREFDYSNFSRTHNITIEDFVHGKWKDLNQNNFAIKGLRFLLSYYFLFPDIQLTPLLYKTLKNKKGFDLLISIAVPYPVHWGVALARKKNKYLTETWVADCGDPFMGNKERNRKMPFYFSYVEKWFCTQPDFVTVPIKEAILAYPSACRKKIKVIPQGFNFDEISIPPKKEKNPYPVFAYAGGIRKGVRDPRKFLEYLCLRSDKKFKFIVYTKTKNYFLLAPYKNRLGDKIEIRGSIDREQLLQELAKMDFLVNLENTGNFQIPSKLIDYALTGRPIISIKPNNFDNQTVDEFLNGDYSNQFKIEDIEKYNIKNIATQFLSLLNR